MSLASYFVRRVISLIPLLIGISMLSFFLFAITPIDPVNSVAGLDPNMQKQRDRIAKEWGLNKPLYVRYWEWAWPMFTRLDFGNSWMGDTPVTDSFFPFVSKTVFLFGIAFLLSLTVSTVLGIISATNRNSVFDQSILFSTLVGFSIPQFVLGIIFIVAVLAATSSQLAANLGMKPTLAIFQSFKSQALSDNVGAIVVAEITMLIGGTAFSTRLVRSQMLNVLSQNYIRTARAKGLSERVVIYKHALRNALLPFVTVIALSLPGILSGGAIIERVFNYPGVGRQLIDAATKFDLPIVLASNMFFGTLSIFMLLVADIVYGLVDPRVRF